MTRHVEPATLVAHLDGELTPAAAGQVEAALAADPELRARLASLERADAALRSAFDPILEAPLPPLALTERPRLGAAVPVDAAGNRRPPAARVAWAAGLAGLVVGFAAGQLGPTLLPPTEPAAVAAIESQLPEVLESELSGTTVALEESSQGVSGTVRAITTFVNADGRYCRTYEARVAAEEGRLVSRGVACRDEDGRWLTRVQVNAV